MRESYRTCLSRTRRKLALSEGLAKHAAGGRTDYVSVVSDDVVSTVGSVVRGEFDCAAALSVHEEHFLAAVDAAAADAKKVMLLDLGSAFGVKAREHFYGSPDVLCLGLNPNRKIRPKDGEKAGDFDTELSWTAAATECGFLAALFRIVLPAGYHFDPDLVIVAVDENSPPQVSGQLVHQVQVRHYNFHLNSNCLGTQFTRHQDTSIILFSSEFGRWKGGARDACA